MAVEVTPAGEKWVKTAMLDDTAFCQLSVNVPDGEMLEIPRDLILQLLMDAGYAPVQT